MRGKANRYRAWESAQGQSQTPQDSGCWGDILQSGQWRAGPQSWARGRTHKLPLSLSAAFGLLFVIIPFPEPPPATSSWSSPSSLLSLLHPHTAGLGGWGAPVKWLRTPQHIVPPTTAPANLPKLAPCQQPCSHYCLPAPTPQSSLLSPHLCTYDAFCHQGSSLPCTAPLSALSVSGTTSERSFLAIQCKEPVRPWLTPVSAHSGSAPPPWAASFMRPRTEGLLIISPFYF